MSVSASIPGGRPVTKTDEPRGHAAGKHVTIMTIDDDPSISPEDKARRLAACPPHEREARLYGLPILGSGKVFPVPEETVRVAGFAIPDYWPQIIGLDFGIDHPFAAVRCAWDRDGDKFYVTACYRQSGETIAVHASAIRKMMPKGAALPIAWPHDMGQREASSGARLAELFEDEGLNMLPEHATHETGGYSTEAGVYEMLERMKTDRFKVFEHCSDWFEEFRFYHRKDGIIVKKKDDLMSATRIAHMMLRMADPVSYSSFKQPDNAWVV